MKLSNQRELTGSLEASQPLIAYVYGEAPPDFAAIAACGFTVVCLDSAASWFDDTTVAEAKAHDLVPVPFKMGYRA
jgi:hypothetical protein